MGDRPQNAACCGQDSFCKWMPVNKKKKKKGLFFCIRVRKFWLTKVASFNSPPHTSRKPSKFWVTATRTPNLITKKMQNPKSKNPKNFIGNDNNTHAAWLHSSTFFLYALFIFFTLSDYSKNLKKHSCQPAPPLVQIGLLKSVISPEPIDIKRVLESECQFKAKNFSNMPNKLEVTW